MNEARGRFWRISSAGIFFQGGAAAVDPSTVVPALVHGLTGSTLTVGAAAGIVRFGWLFPQLFVAYYPSCSSFYSLRYLTLLRDGARAHDLPEHWVRYLESVEHAE